MAQKVVNVTYAPKKPTNAQHSNSTNIKNHEKSLMKPTIVGRHISPDQKKNKIKNNKKKRPPHATRLSRHSKIPFYTYFYSISVLRSVSHIIKFVRKQNVEGNEEDKLSLTP